MARSILPAKYESSKEELMDELALVKFCSFTTDFWSSSSTESYVTVTCHFLDGSWILKSRVLATYEVRAAHTAENIAEELLKVAQEWKVADKIVCIITDNASNMKAAARITGWRHLPCFADI